MTCVKKVVGRKCPIGKMSCNYNISLTIYFQRNAVKTKIQNLMVPLKFAVPSAPTRYILAAYICEFLFLGLCC